MNENCSSAASPPQASTPLEDHQSSPSSIIQRFIQSVDSGTVRSELAEDCVLGLFGRHITGINSVTGYMRTQLMGRYRHTGFYEAQHCHPEDEVILRERFARTFHRTQRRLYQQKERERPSSLHLRADSDDELVDRGSTQVPYHLVTPPRPSEHIMELFTYIQAKGMLEPIHNADDGGINLDDCRQVQITLAYRREHSDEIYLALYEKLKQLRQKSTSATPTPTTNDLQMRSIRISDEDLITEQATTSQHRSVRRTLFASAADLEDSIEADIEPLSLEVPIPPKQSSPATGASRSLMGTPRKRHHRNETNVDSKRPAGLRLYI